jgi:ribosomal protein S18 acetylase RimI-like enzyme
MNMKFYFDQKASVSYEVRHNMPSFDQTKSQLTVRALTLYGMYRNGLYNTRINKPLDSDIAIFEPKYDYEHTSDSTGIANNSLYHYASYVGIDAMQELFKQKDSQCCVGYKTFGRRKIPVGFIVFYEKTIDGQKLVYISHVSVGQFRQGIGTKLIQAVLISYPPDTSFYLCARRTNQDAHRVYQQIGFNFNHQYLNHFSYNPDHFVGMSHQTALEQLHEIKKNLTEVNKESEKSYFHQRTLSM